MNRRSIAAVVLLLCTACACVSRDPFVRAGSATRRGDLLAALQAYENVPAAHARHAEAQNAAAEMEQRMLRSHEALLAALVQRGSGHDRDALVNLQRARDAWPGLPMVDLWITVTRERLALADGAASSEVLEPAVDCEEQLASVAPFAPPAGSATAAQPVPESPFGRAAQQELFGNPNEDPIALGLVAVEARLGDGELELAVIDLLELARRHPSDTRVQVRLVRVLHQRALLRYGQGALIAAIGDWERVLAIQPDNRIVHGLVDAVRAEAAVPSR